MWFQTGSRDDTRACKLSCSLLICSWGAIGNTAAHLGVVRLRGGQQSLQAEQGGLEGERGAPLVLEDVQADGPVGAAHVGVPHLAAEAHLGRHKGVLVLCARAVPPHSARTSTLLLTYAHMCPPNGQLPSWAPLLA